MRTCQRGLRALLLIVCTIIPTAFAGDVVRLEAEVSPAEAKLIADRVAYDGKIHDGMEDLRNRLHGLFELGKVERTEAELDLVNDNPLYGAPDGIATAINGPGQYPRRDGVLSGDDVGDTNRMNAEVRRRHERGSVALRVLSTLYSTFDAQNGYTRRTNGNWTVNIGDLTQVQVELVREYGQRKDLPPAFFLRFTFDASYLDTEGSLGWNFQRAFHLAMKEMGLDTIQYENVRRGKNEFSLSQYIGAGKVFRLYDGPGLHVETTIEVGHWMSSREEFNRTELEAQLRGCFGPDRVICLTAAVRRDTQDNRRDRIEIEYRFREKDGSRCSSVAAGVESNQNDYTRRYPSVRPEDAYTYPSRLIEDNEIVYRMRFKKCF